jgi:hypothetical protein
MGIKRLKDLTDGSSSISSDDLLMVMDNPSSNSTTTKISTSDFIDGLKILRSDSNDIDGGIEVKNMVVITQSAYDSLSFYDPNTVYFII